MTAAAERNGKRAAPPWTALSQYDHFSPRLLEDPLWTPALGGAQKATVFSDCDFIPARIKHAC